jgi:hypothetical protein
MWQFKLQQRLSCRNLAKTKNPKKEKEKGKKRKKKKQ